MRDREAILDDYRQWRVLCMDALVILTQIHKTQQYHPAMLNEWTRRVRLVAARDDEERERIERAHFQPCEHCATYDDVLEIRKLDAAQREQGVYALCWPCCGAPLDFVPMSMKHILRD